jgi:hypothetical protein
MRHLHAGLSNNLFLLLGAAAVESGGDHVSGGLVSRHDWTELESQRSLEEESAVAASAVDAAAVRNRGLLDHEGGSPDGGTSPTYRDGMSATLARNNVYDIPVDD